MLQINAKIVKGVKSNVPQSAKTKAAISGKVNGVNAGAGTSAKSSTSKKTVKKPKIKNKKKTTTKSTATVKKSTSAKATTSKSVLNILDADNVKNGGRTQSKQKGKKLTKIHPEVEKLVKMLTEKMTLIQQRTTATDNDEDEDNQCYETSETDETDDTDLSDLSDDDLSTECDCSDCSDSDDECDELDESDSTDDDAKSCSGCSTCCFSTEDLNSWDNDIGCSSSSFGTKFVVAKLKKKPLKKRSGVVKSFSQSRKKQTKKTTKPKIKKIGSKRKKSLKTHGRAFKKQNSKNKPQVVDTKENLLENHQTLIVSNKVSVKKEHSIEWESKASTSEVYKLSSCSQNTMRKPIKNPKIEIKSEPFTSETLPPVKVKKPITSHYAMPKTNSTFNKPIKKSIKSSSTIKNLRP